MRKGEDTWMDPRDQPSAGVGVRDDLKTNNSKLERLRETSSNPADWHSKEGLRDSLELETPHPDPCLNQVE